MIETNDIENTVTNDMIMYIFENNITYQYETLPGNIMDNKKRPVGRPSTGMKGIYVKLRGSLVEPLSKVTNRNGFINDAIQNKLEDEGLVK